MEEKQLEQLKPFGFTSTNSKTRYTFSEALRSMLAAQKRCFQYYDLSVKSDDDLFAQGMLDGSIKAFEDFTEAFRDVFTMFEVLKGGALPGTLLECIRAFKRLRLCNENGNKMLDFLYTRNKLVHQYYNREYMLEQFRIAQDNYSDGMQDIYEKLYELVSTAGYLQNEIFR